MGSHLPLVVYMELRKKEKLKYDKFKGMGVTQTKRWDYKNIHFVFALSTKQNRMGSLRANLEFQTLQQILMWEYNFIRVFEVWKLKHYFFEKSIIWTLYNR